jgi:hypothetical protein
MSHTTTSKALKRLAIAEETKTLPEEAFIVRIVKSIVTEEVFEDVIGMGITEPLLHVSSLESVFIILLSLVVVAQYLVCLGQLLELLSRLFLVIWILIRMQLHGQLSKGLLDLIIGAVLLQTKHLIVISLLLLR